MKDDTNEASVASDFHDEVQQQFYIAATSSLAERRPRTLKHGDTFALFDHYGDILAEERKAEGLFHEDTRFLSRFLLLINERRPLLLSSTVQNNNAMLIVDLTNPDFYRGNRIVLKRESVHLFRSKFIWDGTVYERLAIRNFTDRFQLITLKMVFDADFADLFEVRGHRRARRGNMAVDNNENVVVFRYRGLDGTLRRTTIRFNPTPDDLDYRRAIYRLRLEPHQRMSLFTTIACNQDPTIAERIDFFSAFKLARRPMRTAAARAAALETSNAVFNEVLCRSMADLSMLTTRTEHGPYPYAGVPWFSNAFGRDGIVTAMQMLWIDPTIAKGVLMFLAATQARDCDAKADAEPGKILHEMRQGEMARLGEVPFEKYYGTVDATPLFVMLAGMYLKRTADLQTIETLWPNIEAALVWIDTHGDRDKDGFVEYERQRDEGLINQGWKDSEDSVFHADGRLAEGPIALAEVQGYVYAAKRNAARIARALGKPNVQAALEEQASRLKERFEKTFWCEDINCYALALDGQKNACRVATSNAGQALFSGIAERSRAEAVADTMLGAGLFSGWGVRTVSAWEARYNPMSYHNGSVWPHDNALIALGLGRYDFKEHVLRVFTGMFEAAAYMDLRRLPELFCGFRKLPGKGPTFYPVACQPQAWAAAAPFAFLEACLGLELDAGANEVRFLHPRLPEFLDQLVIRQLRLRDSRMDILLHRYGNDVAVNVLRKNGDARVEVIL